jgi:hypothetical protein
MAVRRAASTAESLDASGGPVPMEERVIVVHPDSMTDELFCMHLNKRHLTDLGLNSISHHEHTLPSYYGALRAYHARVHAMSPIWQYDHEHDLGES